MKNLAALAALGCVALISHAVSAQSPPPPAPAPAPPPGQGAPPPGEPGAPPEFAPIEMPPSPKYLSEDWAPGDISPEAVKKAEAALKDLQKLYQAAPTLSDHVMATTKLATGGETVGLDFAFGKGDDLRFVTGPLTLTSAGGKVFIEIKGNARRYMEVPIEGSFEQTMETAAKGFRLAVPYRALRSNKSGDEIVESFNLGTITHPKLTGFREKDGNSEILMKGDNGDIVATIDGKTKLLNRHQAVFAIEGAPPGMTVMLDLALSPKVAETLPTPIVPVSAGGRKPVASIEDLMAPVKVGEDAPEFTLTSTDGATVKSADLKGKILVLDFWATWCQPCQRGLPLLNDVAKWVAENKKDVKIYGVDVSERVPAEKRVSFADEFWKKKGFVFPTLIDPDDSLITSYGFQGIPATVVIGPDGKIAAIHEGFDPDETAALKADIEKLLAPKG